MIRNTQLLVNLLDILVQLALFVLSHGFAYLLSVHFIERSTKPFFKLPQHLRFCIEPADGPKQVENCGYFLRRKFNLFRLRSVPPFLLYYPPVHLLQASRQVMKIPLMVVAIILPLL